MVEGQALHYYNPYGAQESFSQLHPFLQKTDQYFDTIYDNQIDLRMPASPYSSQSDSDASSSSVDAHPALPWSKNGKEEMKCCWKSCGVSFDTLDQLASHVTKVHASSGMGGLFYCGWEGCSRNDRGFNARYKMLVHVRTHTNEKPHKCHLCDKSFSRAENLKIHSRSHSGEKPYICPVPGCNKAYSNSSDRFKHTRTHQVEKPYQCKVPGCPKRYTDPSSLRKHVKTYKHFTNENSVSAVNKSDEIEFVNVDNDRFHYDKRMEPENIFSYENGYQSNAHDNLRNCNLACCKLENKTSEILRLNALINMKEDVQALRWNTLSDPYKNCSFQENMDLDMPLDLSINRK